MAVGLLLLDVALFGCFGSLYLVDLVRTFVWVVWLLFGFWLCEYDLGMLHCFVGGFALVVFVTMILDFSVCG